MRKLIFNGKTMSQFFIIALLLSAAFSLKAQADAGVPAQYTGIVVDDQGRPVPGAAVDCYYYQTSPVMMGNMIRDPELKQHTVTDAKGAFAVAASPDTTFVLVRKAGLAPAWKTWTSGGDDSSDPLVLTAPTTLSGVVLDGNNQPVGDADVWVSEATVGVEVNWSSQQNQILGSLAQQCFSARTTRDGHFKIENFPAEAHADLAVASPGLAQRAAAGHYLGSQEYQSGQQDIQLLLGPAGVIEGKVVVQETGQPVANVEVSLLPYDGQAKSHGPVWSGADGSFRFPDLQPDKYNVWAVIPGQPPDLAIVPDYDLATVTAGQTNRDVLIRTTTGILVEVTVVSTNDLKPLANVAVSCERLTAHTDANGKAIFRTIPGKTWFSVSKPDWSPVTMDNIELGQTNSVLIQMIPPPHISGIVYDPMGVPASGVRVSFHPGQYPMAPFYEETNTDQNGRYEMIIRQNSNRNFAWDGIINPTNFVMARDFGRNLAAIQEFGPTTWTNFDELGMVPSNLDLTLQPGITISGSVKDTDGAPITNVGVNLTVLSGHSFANVENKPLKVDGQGSFSFPALPQGREYDIFNLTAKGYGSAGASLKAEDAKTNHYEFPPFVLKKASLILAGQVLGVDGKPAAQIPVRFYGQGQRQNFGEPIKTDSNGRFLFNNVCEGPVTVSADSEHTSANAPAHGGDTNVVFRLGITLVQNRPFLTPPITVTGTVYDSRGRPAAGVKMSMFSYQTGTIASQTDSRGRYEFTWQKRLNGEESEWLLARDLSAGSAAFHPMDETTTNLDLTLQDGITLTARVTDTDGQPLTNATATVTFWHENRGTGVDSQPVTADEHGILRIAALPQGERYWVNIAAPGHSSDTRRVEADDTRTKLLELPPVVLTPTDGEVSGQVLDAQGKPAAGIEVQMFSVGMPTPSTTTDSNGRFEFNGVRRGALSFMAGLPMANSSALSNSGRAGGHSGDTNVVIRLGTDRNLFPSLVNATTSGTVFDPSGAPASGVLLSVLSAVGFNKTVRSDADGKYTMQWQNMNSMRNKAVLLARDQEHNWAAAAEMDTNAANLNIHLLPGLTLSGAVQDSNGRPLTNAIVELAPFPPDNPISNWNRQPPTNVTVSGSFTFSALPQGTPYGVRVSADGYGARDIRVPAADTNTKQLDLSTVVLTFADQRVAGKVTTLSGKLKPLFWICSRRIGMPGCLKLSALPF
ncbi:MAG: carboxypeptidase regulatory-like domain-containing protein [Limisphaerales bacterium]